MTVQGASWVDNEIFLGSTRDGQWVDEGMFVNRIYDIPVVDNLADSLMWLFVFIIPSVVLAVKLGNTGILLGIGLTTIAVMMAQSNFMWVGILNLLGIGVMLMKGET